MRVLFICKHNRFRSKIAEALFNKYNLNKKIKAESAGILKRTRPISQNVIISARSFDLKFKDLMLRQINDSLINRFDLIIIVANDVSKEIFKKCGKKVVIWRIPDVYDRDRPKTKRRIDSIKKKIESLITNFKN